MSRNPLDISGQLAALNELNAANSKCLDAACDTIRELGEQRQVLDLCINAIFHGVVHIENRAGGRWLCFDGICMPVRYGDWVQAMKHFGIKRIEDAVDEKRGLTQ